MGGVPIKGDALISGCLYRSRRVPMYRSVWNLRMYVRYGVTSQIVVFQLVLVYVSFRITLGSS